MSAPNVLSESFKYQQAVKVSITVIRRLFRVKKEPFCLKKAAAVFEVVGEELLSVDR